MELYNKMMILIELICTLYIIIVKSIIKYNTSFIKSIKIYFILLELVGEFIILSRFYTILSIN